MRFLAEIAMPLPRVLHMSAEFVINASLRRLFSSPDLDLDSITALLETARTEKISLDSAGLAYALKQTLDHAFAALRQAPNDFNLLSTLDAAIAMVQSLSFEVDLWRVQNIYFQLQQNAAQAICDLTEEEAQAWRAKFDRLGERLGFELVTERQPAMAA
jgi:hypothetical protein